MITHLTNDSGLVYAYCEWEVLDEQGQFKNNGEHLYIQTFWISDMFRLGFSEMNWIFKMLICLILENKFSYSCKILRFRRIKRKDGLSRSIKIEHILKKLGVKNEDISKIIQV